MAITTLDGLIASTKQRVRWTKTATRTTVANGWFSLHDIAGQPGAGTLAGSSTTAGVVPTDATAGYPLLNAFGGGASGDLGRVAFGNTVACRIAVFDRLFLAGAYAFNANTALTAQPSFSSSEPNAGALAEMLQLETDFEISEGVLKRVDLAAAARSIDARS